MPVTEAEYGDRVPVDGYGPGFFRIGGAAHEGPVIVTPAGRRDWAGLEDRAALLALAGQVDLLFLGMGGDIAHPPAGLAEALDDAGLRVEIMSSPSAARTYNVLLSEDRSVACALIPVGA